MLPNQQSREERCMENIQYKTKQKNPQVYSKENMNIYIESNKKKKKIRW